MNDYEYTRPKCSLKIYRIFSFLFIIGIGLILLGATHPVFGQNKPERLEWFRDLGYGMFIHWSVDSQIGSVISHSLVGASADYTNRYFRELPKTFHPNKFDPNSWARLAKIAGFRYVVFTTKHHSGFCMFETETNADFKSTATPFGKDITSEIVRAFQHQGIVIGFYFSPDDFYILNKQGKLISRRRPEAQPQNNQELMRINKIQVRELLSNYGHVDILFFDGPSEGLVEHAWEIKPEVVITRGVLKTPEIAPSTKQTLPDYSDVEPWEANFTMGTSWQYKPTNETYMTGTEIIEKLIETRAKGGNMLMNVGPTPEGEIPLEQENILREIGLWMFVNGEAIYGVEPWHQPNEGTVWFTKKRNENTVFAFLTKTTWAWGDQKTIRITSLKATANTEVSLLGQNSQVLEYYPEVNPQISWQQTDDGLIIKATRAQRIYNDRTWPNPVVLKITQVKPAD